MAAGCAVTANSSASSAHGQAARGSRQGGFEILSAAPRQPVPQGSAIEAACRPPVAVTAALPHTCASASSEGARYWCAVLCGAAAERDPDPLKRGENCRVNAELWLGGAPVGVPRSRGCSGELPRGLNLTPMRTCGATDRRLLGGRAWGAENETALRVPGSLPGRRWRLRRRRHGLAEG